MDLYYPICRYIVTPLWAAWEGTSYLRHLEHQIRSQYFDPSVMRAYQEDRVKSILDHAFRNTRYYREAFEKAGFDPGSFRGLEDLARVPVLTKTLARENMERLMAPSVPKYVPFLTSGSTGVPIRGFWDKESSDIKRASARRSDTWGGYRLGERVYCLYGNPEEEKTGIRKIRAKLRRKLLNRTEILDLLRVNEERISAFLDRMVKAPPSILWGHGHALDLLAGEALAKGYRIRPKAVLNAGMPLLSSYRQRIREAFDCHVLDRYGCEELGLIATECPEGGNLHINTDCLHLEFLDPEGAPVLPGTAGRVVATDLTNRVMPFIRYELGDVCVPREQRCPCGRTQPVIGSIEGRTADFLIATDGSLVSGISLTDHFAGFLKGIAQVQIVQETRKRFVLRIARSEEGTEPDTEGASKLLRHFMGQAITVEFEVMDKIPLDSRGKFRFAVCNVAREGVNVP